MRPVVTLGAAMWLWYYMLSSVAYFLGPAVDGSTINVGWLRFLAVLGVWQFLWIIIACCHLGYGPLSG